MDGIPNPQDTLPEGPSASHGPMHRSAFDPPEIRGINESLAQLLQREGVTRRVEKDAAVLQAALLRVSCLLKHLTFLPSMEEQLSHVMFT